MSKHRKVLVIWKRKIMQHKVHKHKQIMKWKEMTKYVPRWIYSLDFWRAWPGIEVISFDILTASRGTQNTSNKNKKEKRRKNYVYSNRRWSLCRSNCCSSNLWNHQLLLLIRKSNKENKKNKINNQRIKEKTMSIWEIIDIIKILSK